VDENTRVGTPYPDEVTGDYEAPQIFDLGSVFDVTNGSSSGGGDSNGQGLY
jgi:hypothetical protein